MSIAILKIEKEILNLLRSRMTNNQKSLICLFNSQINAIITDPVFMNVPIEDKMVHRGYSVFETTKVFGNNIYQLDKHLNRFMNSISLINLKSNYTKEEYKTILIELATYARQIEPKSDLELRFYYSAGLGSFFLDTKQELNTFYAAAIRSNNSVRPIDGVNERLIYVDEIKKSLVNAKTTNYLVNCLINKYSKENGGYYGIMVDEEGDILESPISNIAFVTKNDKDDGYYFVLPPFTKTLAGTTSIRCMDFIEKNLINCNNIIIKREFLKIKDLDNVIEAMFLGGDFVIPILKIEDKVISDKPGLITRSFQELFLKDKEGEQLSDIIELKI